MSRKNRDRMAQQAASEAGRILQAQRETSAELSGGENLEPAGDTENNALVRVEPRNNPRNQIMDELIANREKAAEPKEEAQEPATDTTTTETSQTETVADAQPADTPTETPQESPVAKTVRVKVDGKEFDAPEDEVNEVGGVKAYQILKAQENRLRATTEALAQTRQTQAALTQWIEQQNKAAAPQQKTNAQFIQEQMDIIRYGSPEESAAALQAVLEKSQQKVDPNAIIGQAVSVMQQQQAESAFVSEFSDIVHNPLLLKLVINLKEERIKESQGRINDWPKFYRSIGNEVRGAIGRQNQPATAQTGNTTTGSTSSATSDKEARKASIVNLPTAAARAVVPESDKPESREDILRQMKKSRGLQTG